MLTPQEVEERVFPKAKKNGYDMQDVDNFLDQLSADYSELYKENAVLKRKMKVLADKITEYQETEGAMRATLLAAQKMAAQIVDEAKAKRTQILEETERLARERVGTLAEQAAQEEARMKSARASLTAMTASIQDLLTHEQEFLTALPEAEMTVETPVEPDADTADSVAAEIGDSISRMMDEAVAEEPETPAVPAAEETPVEETPGEDAPAEPEEETPAEEPAPEPEETPAEPPKAKPAARPSRPADDDVDTAPTRRLDLSELRFGRNYEIK